MYMNIHDIHVKSLRAKGKLTESLWKLAELQIQPKDEKMRKREKR
jgi:hypothetical protein